ncbi:hypothetical protein GMA11_06910 [Granulicatella sp. zg-ZJ]|uniref:YcaO-like family protein n=1 Tax=Granulicatella sp. zg-ZJ TaxID=2678504 RepID=UPI0013CF9573|nr:YcaO-like family protein [Granulicatella sp. zg-ZJ]NEW63124.1 hypothetical protein [Granulicatella sp. zg-ZJ]
MFGYHNIDINSTKQFFIDNLNTVICSFMDKEYILGMSIDSNRKKAVLKSISELLERRILHNVQECSQIIGKSLIDYEEKIICSYAQEEMKYFYDSNGMACHTNANSSVENAISEFIERQSLLYRYLTKTGLYILPNRLISKYIPTYFSDFSFYNISLVENFYVILCIGVKNKQKYISLGSSIDFFKALKAAISELYQFYHFYNQSYSKQENKNLDLTYASIFHSIETKDFLEAYAFLDKIPYLESETQLFHKATYHSVISELNQEWEINPYCFAFNIDQAFITKIIDFNWFPTLLPKEMDLYKLNKLERIFKRSIDKECNFIPFP